MMNIWDNGNIRSRCVINSKCFLSPFRSSFVWTIVRRRFMEFLVGLDDIFYKFVTHDIALIEINKLDPLNLAKYLLNLDQSRLLSAWQVDLRLVAGYDRFRALSQSGQEHLHLHRRRVLCFVENDERVV